MAKKVAVIAFNPVNGMGLFQYLEAFFENNIPFRTFAIADSKEVKTNSGVGVVFDDVIANLKGHEGEYDALVFSCGDGFLTFSENAGKQYNKDVFDVLKAFDKQGKLIAGHCAVSILFDGAGVITGKKVAVHPLAKSAIANGIATDEKYVVDKNIYTAQTENSIWELMPKLLEALK